MRRIIKCATIALALTAALVAGCGSDSDGTGSPPSAGLLTPGAELDGMRLTTAGLSDESLFGEFCDPFMLQPGSYERDCEVPQRQRLMIGHGYFADTPELLEQEWQALRWEAYLDGRQVDLAAFGTLPDSHYFDTVVGREIWLRLWAVTVINPTPGQHTLRYLSEPSEVADAEVERYDGTWTFTVV